MNNFKSIRVISEAAAAEYILDDDDSEEELAPRADGEAEFVDLHTAVSIAHPVAGDNQFKSDKDQAVTKNAESDNAEGEDKPVKQGTSGDTKFAQFRDKLGKTPARKGDKSQGDMKAETVKEEVELDEAQKLFMFKTKPEADKKAKEIKGKVVPLGPKNFAVVTMDLTVVKEEIELDEADATVKQQKSLKALMTKALGGKRSKPGYKSSIANNGDFVVADGGGRIVGRIKSGDYKDPMKEEVELDEAVKAGMMKLKDGKSVKVSPDEAKMFNDVMKELNPENRKRMEMEMMKDQKSYKSMLTFAKRTG